MFQASFTVRWGFGGGTQRVPAPPKNSFLCCAASAPRSQRSTKGNDLGGTASLQTTLNWKIQTAGVETCLTEDSEIEGGRRHKCRGFPDDGEPDFRYHALISTCVGIIRQTYGKGAHHATL